MSFIQETVYQLNDDQIDDIHHFEENTYFGLVTKNNEQYMGIFEISNKIKVRAIDYYCLSSASTIIASRALALVLIHLVD